MNHFTVFSVLVKLNETAPILAADCKNDCLPRRKCDKTRFET